MTTYDAIKALIEAHEDKCPDSFIDGIVDINDLIREKNHLIVTLSIALFILMVVSLYAFLA